MSHLYFLFVFGSFCSSVIVVAINEYLLELFLLFADVAQRERPRQGRRAVTHRMQEPTKRILSTTYREIFFNIHLIVAVVRSLSYYFEADDFLVCLAGGTRQSQVLVRI